MNRYGSATQENGKITRILSNTWCHQCKMKHQKIVVCDHFWHEDKSVKCNGRYCPNCCKRHYGEEISDLENLESWICYKCTGKCVCAACRRLRNGEVTTTTKNIPSQIQKGKRKRSNKAKSYEESEEEEEFGEEEFIPIMFEKNLRSRNKNDSPTNTSSIPNNPTNNNIVHSQNTTVPIKKTPTNLGMHESAKMPIPKKKEIPKIPLEKKVKIHIPEEELEKANSTSNYLFDILLQVTSLESMQDDGAPPKQSGGNNNNNNVDSKQITSNLGNPSNNKSNPSEPHPNSSILLNNLIHKIPPSEIKKTDLQKILKYESIQSNPLLPSSFHTIVQLRQEVSSLTSELNNMRQDFMKLQRLFESYSQTNEGSHECSPIADGENYVSHPVENFVHNI